jgi:hypothetical protein
MIVSDLMNVAVETAEKSPSRGTGSPVTLEILIQGEQDKVARCEGKVVASRLQIGKYLAELRGRTCRGWTVQLRSLGVDARAARRYVKLGKTELAAVGPGQPDLLAALPTDLVRLDWLSRLSVEQVRGLLARGSLREASRTAVIAAVKGLLGGQGTPAKAAPSLEKEVKGLFKRLHAVIGRFPAWGPGSGDAGRLCPIVLGGLQDVQIALDAWFGPDPAAPGAR